jgi:hypothetical protein
MDVEVGGVNPIYAGADNLKTWPWLYQMSKISWGVVNVHATAL